MILGERSKVRIREIKGKLEEREKDFWHFWEILEKKKKPERKREKGERGKILAKNQHLLKRKKGDLAFQRAHTLKSSLRVKLGA